MDNLFALSRGAYSVVDSLHGTRNAIEFRLEWGFGTGGCTPRITQTR